MELERHEPDRVEIDGQRYYRTPGGVYASVTTILKATVPAEDEKRLADWRERAGPEEVAKVDELRDEGADRGSRMHAAVEAWVDDPFSDGPQETDDPWWNSIVPFLRKVVIRPVLCESAVWHDELRYGGTLDMVAWCRPGVLALLDWKSARKKKKRKWIGDFIQQTAAYAEALRWMTGVQIKDAVVVVAQEKEPADTFWIAEDELREAFAAFAKRARAFNARTR